MSQLLHYYINVSSTEIFKRSIGPSTVMRTSFFTFSSVSKHICNVKYWWKCDKGHSYKASPGNRLGKGTGCPYCSGRLVIKGYNDLQTKYPDLAKEWDYEKNSPLLPSDVPAGTQRKVWWKCDKGQSYQRIILDKVTYKSECPFCVNRLTLTGFNDIATANPDLLLEWDNEKNCDVSPSDMRSNSRIKVWWKCSKGHSWKTTVSIVPGKKLYPEKLIYIR